MDANEYQELSKRTLRDEPGFEISEAEMHLIDASLCAAIAAASILESLKKFVLHQHGWGITNKIVLGTKINGLGLLLGSLEEAFDAFMDGREANLPKVEWSGDDVMKLWGAIGLMGESGEVGRMIWESTKTGEPVDPDKLGDELGDVEWYTAATATKYGLSLGKVMADNVAKLATRYPNGFTPEDSVKRRDAKAK